MEAIRDWLNGDRDYILGTELYLKYGDDEDMKKLFQSKGISKFKKKKLFDCLRYLWVNRDESRKQKAKSIRQKAGSGRREAGSIKPKAKSQKYKEWNKNETDKVLIALHQQWVPAFKEMKTLHAQLLLMDTDIERGAAAHQILRLDKFCSDIYAKRDYYKEKGRLPEEKKPDEIVSFDRVGVRLENVKTYVRRYRSKLKKDPSNEKWAALLKKYTEEKKYYIQKLGLDG